MNIFPCVSVLTNLLHPFATMTSSQTCHGWTFRLLNDTQERVTAHWHWPQGQQPYNPPHHNQWYLAQSPISCASQANSLASSSPLCRFWRTPRCYNKFTEVAGEKSFIWTWHLSERIWILKRNSESKLGLLLFDAVRLQYVSDTVFVEIMFQPFSTTFGSFFLVGYHGLKHREGLGVKVVCLANVKGHRSNGEHLRDQGALPCSSHKSRFVTLLREKSNKEKGD